MVNVESPAWGLCVLQACALLYCCADYWMYNGHVHEHFTQIFIWMQHTIYTETPALFNENIWAFSITIWNNWRLLLLHTLSLYSMLVTRHRKINCIELQTQKDYLHFWGQFMYHRFWTSIFLTPAAGFVWAVEQFVAIGCLAKFGDG